MKKIIMSLVLCLNLVYIPITPVNLEGNKLENIEYNKNESITNYNYDPSYPSFDFYANNYSALKRLYIDSSGDNWLPYYSNSIDKTYSKVGNGSWYNFEWEVKRINILNYAPNKQVFLNNYKNMEVSFFYNYNTWDSSTGWSDSLGKNINSSIKSNKNYTLDSSDRWFNLTTYHNETNKAHANMDFGWNWNGNEIIFKWRLSACVYWTGWSSIDHSSLIIVNYELIKFNSTFSQNNLKEKIIKSLESPFEIKSDTSANISSEEKNGIAGNLTKSNKEFINDEIEKRLKYSFGVDYDAWFNKPILKRNDTFNDEKSFVSITFKDEQQISGNSQFLSNVVMPITVKLTDLYYQRSAQKRLQVVPGKIVNPNSNKNELVVDKPEYDPKNNTLIYHNSVDITFFAISESEIMTVNGKEVPVFNNIYRIKLDDSVDTYRIEVNGIKNSGNITKLSLNINIQALSNQLSYRWVGWNPKENLEQSKLIEKNLPDGKPNPDYDSSINPKTGMRNEYVYIEKKSNYPFYQDPLDKFGNRITDFSNKNTGIIVEASVANSGVTLIEKFDMSKIYRVDRLRLNEELEAIETQKNVSLNLNEQWSKEGIWHYVIYLKDYVDKEIDPSNPGNEEILATKGSTIHKMLYISNKTKDYTKFSSLDFVIKNQNISRFWNSLQGSHLKNYLINYTTINTSQKIEQLSYEQVIMYWKKYVSDQISQKVDVPQTPVNFKDLKNLNMSNLKMNELNPIEVRNKIVEHIKKYVKKYSDNAVYKEDYTICDSNENQIENIDFKDFTSFDENKKIKKINLYIMAINTSSLLIGRKEFTIINNKDFEENNVLDLSKINNLKEIKYNFTNLSNEKKQNFVKNYIYDYVEKILESYKPINIKWDYIYKEDYYISINSKDGVDIKDLDTFEKTISLFLNSKEESSIEVFINSSDDSIKLSGFTSYKIINDPSSKEVAPDKPTPPTPPDNKNHQEDKTKIYKKNLWWIISCVIPFIGLIIFFIWWKKNKKNKRIK